MKEDFVTYDLAVKLKEKGFNVECHAYYEPLKHCLNLSRVLQTNSLTENYNCITAPTISQVLKWLRENKKLHVSIMTFMFRAGWCYEVVRLGENPKLVAAHRNSYNTYEKAAIAGVNYCLENLI